MNRSKDGCCEVSQLELLLADQLDEERESKLMGHLSHCPDCQRKLEATSAGSHLWKSLPDRLRGVASELLENATEPHFDLPEESATSQFDLLTEYLGPTDHPEMLGRIGAYEVCGLIGHGSTGIVVKALEPRLNRYVAIKILSPSFAANGPARRRFEREARAVAAVSHEHVVPVFAVDEHRGIPYIVMQYVSGCSLAQRIERNGPLDTCQVARIGLQIASGLAAAHAQGIVHRDIKPANVMLENSVDRVLVTDFGLARVADEAAATRSGVIAGTPQFMSPEQAKGNSIDHRSDLFSLGSTLYAACTGSPPFRAETLFGVIHRVCEEEPRAIRETNPEIGDWLEALIDKLMTKDREDRFDSAEQVSNAITQELAHMQNPTAVTIPSRKWQVAHVKRAWTWPTERTTLLGMTVVSLLLALAALFQSNTDSSPTAQAGTLTLVTQATNGQAAASSITGQEKPIELTEEMVFPASPGGQLVLDVDRGHVLVETGGEGQLKLVVERKIAGESEAEAEKIAALHRINSIANDNGVTIKAEMDPELRKARPTPMRGVSFKLMVPSSYNHTIATAGGHITIKGRVVGDVNVKTSGGHISLSSVDGKVQANTSGGNISVRDVNGTAELITKGGNLTLGRVSESVVARTSGGNITVEDTGGALEALTSGGNITARISKQPQAECKLITSGGNVQVKLASQLRLTVDASAAGGGVTAPFASDGKKKRSLKAELNGGGATLSARTSGGNIRFSYISAAN